MDALSPSFRTNDSEAGVTTATAAWHHWTAASQAASNRSASTLSGAGEAEMTEASRIPLIRAAAAVCGIVVAPPPLTFTSSAASPTTALPGIVSTLCAAKPLSGAMHAASFGSPHPAGIPPLPASTRSITSPTGAPKTSAPGLAAAQQLLLGALDDERVAVRLEAVRTLASAGWHTLADWFHTAATTAPVDRGQHAPASERANLLGLPSPPVHGGRRSPVSAGAWQCVVSVASQAVLITRKALVSGLSTTDAPLLCSSLRAAACISLATARVEAALLNLMAADVNKSAPLFSTAPAPAQPPTAFHAAHKLVAALYGARSRGVDSALPGASVRAYLNPALSALVRLYEAQLPLQSALLTTWRYASVHAVHNPAYMLPARLAIQASAWCVPGVAFLVPCAARGAPHALLAAAAAASASASRWRIAARAFMSLASDASTLVSQPAARRTLLLTLHARAALAGSALHVLHAVATCLLASWQTAASTQTLPRWAQPHLSTCTLPAGIAAARMHAPHTLVGAPHLPRADRQLLALEVRRDSPGRGCVDVAASHSMAAVWLQTPAASFAGAAGLYACTALSPAALAAQRSSDTQTQLAALVQEHVLLLRCVTRGGGAYAGGASVLLTLDDASLTAYPAWQLRQLLPAPLLLARSAVTAQLDVVAAATASVVVTPASRRPPLPFGFLTARPAHTTSAGSGEPPLLLLDAVARMTAARMPFGGAVSRAAASMRAAGSVTSVTPAQLRALHACVTAARSSAALSALLLQGAGRDDDEVQPNAADKAALQRAGRRMHRCVGALSVAAASANGVLPFAQPLAL
ncbi:hypothetical protein EON62_00400 [archaeon]|nr:MAG: hypothetical protein EON62_00400 [archaeon]